MGEEQNEFSEGDAVSWKWGAGRGHGTISEVVTDGKASVTSNKGNTVTRKAKDGDAALKISREGNDVVKLSHEVEKEMA
ncbi:hypothetical protein FRC03_010233 [Tulasnella sp. 419]|nr:hypothetical protein FRC03_010233 [Tulasnella sp. 419]